ncbi:MAG: hypothetical protein WB660_28805 [Candidatus Sulfotelmatobacter sp.]
MQESKTHFEQISVEAVKQIATELSESSAIENDRLSSETQNEVTSSQKDWRQLAQRIQQEQDPKKMTRLVHQLVATLDEKKFPK